MNSLTKTLEFFALISVELTVLFLGISSLVALALMYIPKEKIQTWLSHRGIIGNFLGVTIGSLTPFCACSTIPMTTGLLKAGAPFGPVMSFVIASPLLNPIIIAMVAALMGMEAAIIYFATTFLGSVLFGLLLEKIGGGSWIRPLEEEKKSCCCSGETGASPFQMVQREPTFKQKLKMSFTSAWKDFVKVLPFLLIGVALGAAIYGYMPEELVISLAGPDNPFAIPVAAVLGIPLYIRAETAIPIGIALADKGMSMGAVIALIIGGAGMAIPEISMLLGIFKKRLVAAIVGVIFSTAVLGGLLFNTLL